LRRSVTAALGRQTALTAGPGLDLSTELVSEVATFALKTRLKSYERVSTRVQCSPFGLLTGGVDGVQLDGTGWCSPLGLSCRSIECSTGAVQIDTAAVLTQQAIVLRTPPRGDATVRFNEQDFAAFLQHPLMVKAAERAVGGKRFSFKREASFVGGAVVFAGVADWDGGEYQLKMETVDGRGTLAVAASARQGGGGSAEGEQQVGEDLARFFNSLALNLEGVELKYRTLKLQPTPPVVELALDLTVWSFPPPSVSF